MPSVTYSKAVSDANIKAIMQKIADAAGVNITVHSGDRNFVPKGGSKTSLHLKKRAADFHISGMTDADGFAFLKANKDTIFDYNQSYELIHHGTYTQTGGPHLHIGRYGQAKMGYVDFKIEGLTAKTKGVYQKTREYITQP